MRRINALPANLLPRIFRYQPEHPGALFLSAGNSGTGRLAATKRVTISLHKRGETKRRPGSAIGIVSLFEENSGSNYITREILNEFVAYVKIWKQTEENLFI